MTEHLPECEAYRDECGGGCICHHVRACEQRVLNAAREAVAATVNDPNDPKFVRTEYQCCGTSAPEYMRDDALDAIDALRRKGNDEAG